MATQYSTITIIGVGLLGASIGLAAKTRGLAQRVIGVGRRRSSLDRAIAAGAIDEAFTDTAPALAGADLVAVCTPADLVTGYLDAIRAEAPAEAIVTDVASTKARICEHARATWPAPRRFVGAHPMAGSEKFGPEHGDAALFEGAVCFVEDADDLDPGAAEAVAKFWRALGSRVVRVDPVVHDRLAARTSHIPHIAAAALAQLIGVGDDVGPFIGNGFKDTTRIAEGRPEVWRDICLTNRDAIGVGLDELIASLTEMRAQLGTGNGEHVEAFFERGRNARLKALDS